MLSKPEIYSYLAGIVDDEGTIGATFVLDKRRGTSHWQFVVRCGMTDSAPIQLLYTTFGGAIRLHTDTRNAPRRLMYIWSAYGKTGAAALVCLLPYLQVKHEQAKAFLDAMPTFTGGPKKGHKGSISPSSTDLQLRSQCADRIRQLNQRSIYAC